MRIISGRENVKKYKDVKETTDSSSTYKKVLKKEFDCSFCPPNRIENSGGHRIPKPDKHKNKKRNTIRKQE